MVKPRLKKSLGLVSILWGRSKVRSWCQPYSGCHQTVILCCDVRLSSSCMKCAPGFCVEFQLYWFWPRCFYLYYGQVDVSWRRNLGYIVNWRAERHGTMHACAAIWKYCRFYLRRMSASWNAPSSWGCLYMEHLPMYRMITFCMSEFIVIECM
jgi:hypothetical protein